MSDEGAILVVDDQAQNIRLLDAVFSPRGYRVLTAESGERRWTYCAKSSRTWSCSTS